MHSWIRLCVFAALCVLLGAGTAFAKGDTLTVGLGHSTKTLDPQATPDAGTHNICVQIYEGLTATDDTGATVPRLAEKWEILEGGKAFKFSLKKGVKFHNGETMTADDVVFTFKRATGPQGGAIRALSMFVDPNGIEKIDDHTVLIRTTLALGQLFLDSLSHPWASILNKKAVEQSGKDYGVNPVGTGCFKLVSWVFGDRATFERFDDYHGAPPKLKRLVMRTIVENSSRTIELESGAVDVILDPARVDIPRIEANTNLKIVRKPGSRIYYLSFDVTKPPYDNLKVRQAMDMVVDREGIVKAVFRGYAEASNGPLSSAIKYNRVKESPPRKRDIAGAKKLLAEAGFPNGFKGALLLPDLTERVACGTILQANFQEIGIEMEANVVEWGAFMEAIRLKDHDPFLSAWWGSEPALDPFFVLGPSFHSAVIGQTNRSWYSDKLTDELLTKGSLLADGPEREAVYKQLWDRLNETVPWIFFASPINMYCMDKDLEGVNWGSGSVTYYGNAYFKN